MTLISNIKLSVVIPVYNEEASLPFLYEQLKKNLEEYTHEIIFVNDGSKDNSLPLLEDLKKNDRSIKIFSLNQNLGKATALNCGFLESRGEIVITMDADLQDDPSEIPRFIEKIEAGYDVVCGWRYIRHDPLSKTVPSLIFNSIVSLSTGIGLHDINCGFKAYRSPVIKKIHIYGDLHRYIPVLARMKGYKIAEIKVKHFRRRWGKTKYGFARFRRGALDLATVVFLLGYLSRPMHFFGSIALMMMTPGLLFSFYLLALWANGTPIGSRPLLLLSVLLIISGLIFFMIGLLGEIIIFSTASKNTVHYLEK